MVVDVRSLNPQPHPPDHLKSWRRPCWWHLRQCSDRHSNGTTCSLDSACRPSSTTASTLKAASQGCRPTCSSARTKEQFSFIMMDPPTMARKFSFHFSSNIQDQKETLKRCRPVTDVDGPNTSSLSCKKRRLRLELITSRLSQPFSLPATHILNREGLARGDKRFVKMGTCASMVKRGLSFNASSSPFWRVALLNQTKLHIRDAHLEKLGDMLSRAMVLPHEGTRRPPLAAVQQFAQTLPTPAVGRRSRSPVPSPPASPRLHPVDLASADPIMCDLDDEDGEAFPAADHASLYDVDDPDEVYSDFSAIFGPDADPGGDEDEHSYEEYLDELDGISWVVR